MPVDFRTRRESLRRLLAERELDAILVTAAAPRIPEPLWRQLGEGGRLVMPLGDQRKSQRLIRARKTAGQAIIEDLSEVLFVPLRGAVEKPAR